MKGCQTFLITAQHSDAVIDKKWGFHPESTLDGKYQILQLKGPRRLGDLIDCLDRLE